VKSKLTTVAVVATVHLLVFWISIGILKASGFTLFNLFGPPHRNSLMQELLFGFVGILSYPMAGLAELLALPDNWLTMICGLVLNSVFWGICIGLAIYVLRHRHQRHAD
jgi:hypothetical protein